MNRPGEPHVQCAVQSAEMQDLYHRQMQDYQTSLVRFSEIKLPTIVKASNPTPITEPIYSIGCSHGMSATLSTRATIDALKKLQAKILADISTLESETIEQTHPLSQVVTDDNGFSKAIVSFYASPRAEPLSNETSALPSHSSTKPPRIAMNSPSTGIPILMKTPLKVQSPQSEHTTDRFPSYPAVSSPMVSLPAVDSTPFEPSVDNNYHETGTEYHSDLESVSEETEHESGCSDNEVIDKGTIHRKRTQKPSVKAEQVQKNQKNSSTPDIPITKGKRQRAPADRYTPDNVKRIKEEGVYLSSDKRVKAEGAPIRADQEAFKTLRHCYGKQWKRVQGLGMFRDQEVVINPRGVEYRLKNNPKLGTDFFLTAQEALAYCVEHCTPINPLPDSRDTAPVVTDPVPVNSGELDPGISVDNDLNSYNGYSDGNDVSSLEGYYFKSCSCSSRANCHCFDRQ